MSDDQETILQDAFAEAVALAGPPRRAFVSRFAAAHPTLAERLERLLTADAAIGDEPSDSIAKSIEGLSLDDVDPWIGRSIGPYTISSRIGAGGMGAVFLADRADDEFAQQVAVKIMSTQLLSPNATARFRTERQILASLNHPHIAKLLDGGSTEDGLPFLIMEHINGVAIDDYCEATGLDLRARIRLFQKVCKAVDYAHRNLVVHRDLKPSNILVDENHEPKLLDFGIAKLIDPEDAERTLAQTGRDRIMTPDYASPEQVRGEKISIATDVYALGVLLFRLLTGQSPYRDSKTPREVENAILNTEPLTPSSALSASTKALSHPTGNTSVDHKLLARQHELRRLIKGDLDNIVLKCLQKEPERRYVAARDLADDLERYLLKKPVLAHGDEWTYKARKFIVRRARPLSAAAGVVALIIGLTTYYTIQLSQQRNEAVRAAEAAQRSAQQSQEIADFLGDLFASASPVAGQGREITAIEVLDEGVKKIDELDDHPLVQAELLRIMGASYIDLGYSDLSVELTKRSVDVLRNAEDTGPLVLARALHELAEAQRLHGELIEAEASMRAALDIRIQELGLSDTMVARTFGRLGTILFDAKKMDEGLRVLRRAIEIKTAASPKPDEELIDMRGNLAITLDSLGEYDEAEELMRENVVLSERISGELFPNTIIRLSNLGLVQLRRARYEEGMATAQEALRRAEIVWPENHPNIGVYNSIVGMTYLDLGDFDKALEHAEKGVAIALAGTGEMHFRYVARLRTLAIIRLERGEFKDADAALAKALRIIETLTDEVTYQGQKVLLHTGQLRNYQQRFDEAEPWLRRALDYPDTLGHSNELHAKLELAESVSRQGRPDEALTLFNEVIAAHAADENANNQILVPPLTRLAAHYRRNGDLTNAEATAQRAASIGAATLAEGHWHTAFAEAQLALALNRKGEHAEALELAQRASAVLEATLSSDDWRLQELQNGFDEPL